MNLHPSMFLLSMALSKMDMADLNVHSRKVLAEAVDSLVNFSVSLQFLWQMTFPFHAALMDLIFSFLWKFKMDKKIEGFEFIQPNPKAITITKIT